jgi:putative ABC transport system permease protein
MTELWRDIRYGLRLLWKSAGFTSVSLLALALGIGATTAIFSLLYSVLLAPLPYVDSDRIVMVWSHQRGDRNGTSPSDYIDGKNRAKSSTLSTHGLARASPSPRPIGPNKSRPAA